MTHVPESGADTGNDKTTHAKAVVPDTVVSELGAEKSDKKWGFGGNEDFAWNALVFSPVQEIIAKPEARVYSWAGNGVSQSLARESFPGSVGAGSYLFNPYDNRGDRGQPFVPLRTAFNTDTGMRQSVVEALSVPRLQGNDLMSALEVLRGMPAVTGPIEPVVVKPIIETSTASSTDQQNQQQYKLVPNPDTGEMQLVVTDGTGQQRTIAVTKALDIKDQVVLGNGTAIDIPKDVRIKGPDAINTYVQKQSEQLKDKPVEFSLTQNGEPLTIVKRADGTLAVLSKTTDFKDVEQAVLKANKEPVTGIPAGDGIAQPARQVLFKPNEAATQEGDKKLLGLPKDQLDAKVSLPGGLKEPTISRNLYETGYNAGQPKAQLETGKSAGFVPKALTFNDVFSGGNALSVGSKGNLKLGEVGPVGAGLNSGGVGSVDRSIGTRGQLLSEIAPKMAGQGAAFNPGFNPANLKDAAPRLQQAGANYINRAEMIRPQSSAVQVKEQPLLNSGLPTDPYGKLQRLHDLREGALDPKPLATSGSGRITTAGAEKQTDLKSALQRLQEQKLSSQQIKEQLGQQSVQRSLTKELPGQPGYRPTGDLTLKNDGVTQRQLTTMEKGRLPTGTQTGQFASERSIDARMPNGQPKLQTTPLDTNSLAARLQGKLNPVNPEQIAALMQKGPAPAGKTDIGTGKTDIGALAPKPEKGTGFAPPARSLGADNGTGSFSAAALDKMGSGIKNIPANDRIQTPQTKADPRTEQMREQAAQRKVNGERPNTAPTADLTKSNKVTGVEKVQPPQKVQGSEKPLVQQQLVQPVLDRNPRLVKQNDGKQVDLKPIADAMSRPIKQGDTNLQGKLTTPPQRLDGLRPQPFDMTKVTSQVGKLSEANLGKIRDALTKSNDVTKGARTGDGSAYTPIKISRNFGSEAASKTIAIKGDKVVDLPNRRVTDEAKVSKSYTTNTPLDLSSKRLVDQANKATVTDIRTAGNTTVGKRSDVLALAPKLDSAKTKAALADVTRGLTAAKATDAARILTGRKEQAVTGDKSYTVRLNTNNIKQIADRTLVPGARNQQQQQAEKGLRLVGDKVSKTPTARLADEQTATRRPVERQIAISPKTLSDKQITSGRVLSDKLAGTRALIEKGTSRVLTDKVINNASRVLGDRSAIRVLTNNDRATKTAGSERQIAGKDNHQIGSRQHIAADRQPAIARNLADNSPKAGRTTGDQTAAAGRRVADRPDLQIAAARAEKATSQYVVRIAEKGTNLGDRLPQLTPSRAHELIGKAIRTESHATGEKGSRIAGTKDLSEKALSEKALATRDKGELKGLLQLETKTGKFTINIDGIKRDIGEKKVKHDDYALRDGALNCADKRYLTGIELLLAGLATISAVARMRADQTTAKSVDEGKETQDALPGLTIENWDGDEEEETLLELAVKRGLMGNIDRSTILTRPKYLIQPGDTLTSIAEEVMHDSMLGWLILHINAGSIKTQWEGDICLTELELRQEIELPIAQDIVEFYRSRPNLRYKNKRLVTTQKQNTFDRELLVNNFRNVIAGATARKAQDLPAV